jgi:hypothetical protein
MAATKTKLKTKTRVKAGAVNQGAQQNHNEQLR